MIGQGRAGLRCQIKTQISKMIVQATEKPPSKILRPNTSKTLIVTIPIQDYATLLVNPKGNINTRVIDRKIMQDVSKEIPIYPDQVYRPPSKPVKLSIPEIARSLSDIDPELNTDFEEVYPFQEGVILEMYLKPDKSYFQEPQELEGLINTGKLIQKVLTVTD